MEELRAAVGNDVLKWKSLGGRRFQAEFDRDEIATGEVVKRLSGAFAIHDLIIEEPGIEEIVRRIYREGAV